MVNLRSPKSISSVQSGVLPPSIVPECLKADNDIHLFSGYTDPSQKDWPVDNEEDVISY